MKSDEIFFRFYDRLKPDQRKKLQEQIEKPKLLDVVKLLRKAEIYV